MLVHHRTPPPSWCTHALRQVMDPDSQQGPRELQAEVDILSRVHHPHVLLLLGVCTEPGRQALVYELMGGGSLEAALGLQHAGQQQAAGQPTRARPALLWPDRVRIASEVACALLHLHTGPSPIIHMDVKPANILLSR